MLLRKKEKLKDGYKCCIVFVVFGEYVVYDFLGWIYF